MGWGWLRPGLFRGLALPCALAWPGVGRASGASACLPEEGGSVAGKALAPVPDLCAHRLHKCRLCYKQLKSISGLVKSKSGLSGRHGSAFRELHLLMASLD